jgi:hypothetical protein
LALLNQSSMAGSENDEQFQFPITSVSSTTETLPEFHSGAIVAEGEAQALVGV